MPDAKLTEGDVERMIVNPIYTTAIHPDLWADEVIPLVSREEWIQANANLIAEIGAEAWLGILLDVLGGDYPRSHD